MRAGEAGDEARIDIDEPGDIRSWCDTSLCTSSDLCEAVNEVGLFASKVTAFRADGEFPQPFLSNPRNPLISPSFGNSRSCQTLPCTACSAMRRPTARPYSIAESEVEKSVSTLGEQAGLSKCSAWSGWEPGRR